LYLFVILDIYSRYVVGWTVQHQETAALAERLIAETLAKQQIPRHQLTIHADRSSAMRSKPVAFLLADLGFTKTHSRPYTSTDNPYSERSSRRSSTGLGSSPGSTRSSTPARSAASFPLVQRVMPISA
jgi:transposase InsO family protein